MSIATPCIIVFNDFDPASEVVSVMMPYINASSMTFQTINNDDLSTTDQTTTHTSLSMSYGEIQYDGYPVYTGVGSEFTQYWDDPLARTIYVTNWGTVSSSDQDNLYSWLTENGAGRVLSGNSYTLAGMLLKFNDLIIPYRTYGYIGYTANGHDFDYLDWYNSATYGYRVRFDLGSYRVVPYDNGDWVDTSYQAIVIGSTGADLTKAAFMMWVLLNTTPLVMKTYSLGWRYTPLSS